MTDAEKELVEKLNKYMIIFPVKHHVTRDLYEIKNPHPVVKKVDQTHNTLAFAVTDHLNIGWLVSRILDSINQEES